MKMQRILCFFLCCLMVVAICGCSDKSEKQSTATGEKNTISATDEATNIETICSETDEQVSSTESEPIRSETAVPESTAKDTETNTVPDDTTPPESTANPESTMSSESTTESESANESEETNSASCQHEGTKVLNKKDATCDSVGYTGDTYCQKCNALISYGEDIQPTGHKNTELRNAKEATTESEGYTGDTYCKDCKMIITPGSVIPKVQKVETPSESTTKPETTSKPEETMPASCNHKETKVLNKKDATCDRAGYTGDIYCQKCNALISHGEDIQSTGHKNTELRNSKEATTESEGYTGDVYCKDCKKIITPGSVIPKIQKVETPTEKRARTMAAATQKTSHQYYSTEMEILRLINIEREKEGFAPLEWYEDAYYFVKIRATEHLTPNGHTRPNGTSWHSVYYDNGVLTDSVAENLAGAVNYPTDNLLAEFAVEAWMNSAGHRANIMNAKYTLTAISIVEVNGTIAIAQHFFN